MPTFLKNKRTNPFKSNESVKLLHDWNWDFDPLYGGSSEDEPGSAALSRDGVGRSASHHHELLFYIQCITLSGLVLSCVPSRSEVGWSALHHVYVYIRLDHCPQL